MSHICPYCHMQMNSYGRETLYFLYNCRRWHTECFAKYWAKIEQEFRTWELGSRKARMMHMERDETL
jgi:tRNA(Ile2) C34 agmatinyltransferase TiaS